MSASDLFSWLPDWGASLRISYRFDTVINSSEPGAEQSRIPLYSTMKRTMSCTMFSPQYLANIENFLRKMHADFFIVPLFPEPITPTGTHGASLRNVHAVAVEAGVQSYFNLNNLCSDIMMVDRIDQKIAELHTLTSVDSDTQITIGGTFYRDFYIGRTLYFPCMRAYVNDIADALATTALCDTEITFEEHF